MNRPKRRSLLFVPASKDNFYTKAFSSSADSLIFDLEDSIPDSNKAQARLVLADLFPKGYSGDKELCIRINHSSSVFYEADLSLIKSLRPHSIVYPKAETITEMQELNVTLQQSEVKAEIIVIIETLAGFYNIREILRSCHNITGVVLGTEDLVSEMGIERKRLDQCPVLSHMQVELAISATMCGIQCLGPISRGFRELEHLQDLEIEGQFLRSMNIKGKLAIHPFQVPIINRIFDITPTDIEDARALIVAFQQAETNGTAVLVTPQGSMQDTPSLKKAKRLLEYAAEHGFDNS